MSPKKKKDKPEDNLKNYTEIDKKSFWKMYKETGNKDGYLKVVDTAHVPKYYIYTRYLKSIK